MINVKTEVTVPTYAPYISASASLAQITSTPLDDEAAAALEEKKRLHPIGFTEWPKDES